MDSMSIEPPRRTTRGWWMDEALAEDPGEPCPSLAADTAADIVILGGGYTGMWTAYFLKERDPGIDVVLLEQDICGGGPSGRNGGFVNGYWSSIGNMARRFGDGDALEVCLAASRSVAEIGRFCQRNDIDAWFTFGGELAVASNPFQEGAWDAELDEARRLGAEDEFVELSPDEVRKRVDSPVLLGGVFHPDAATVQPARLARGLRRVLLERGVRIYEGTPVRRFAAGRFGLLVEEASISPRRFHAESRRAIRRIERARPFDPSTSTSVARIQTFWSATVSRMCLCDRNRSITVRLSQPITES